jgi:hypothetical protein
MTDKIYQKLHSCNKCGSENKVKPNDMDGMHICEASTICKFCGFVDYWAYGHFESSQDGYDKAERY